MSDRDCFLWWNPVDTDETVKSLRQFRSGDRSRDVVSPLEFGIVASPQFHLVNVDDVH